MKLVVFTDACYDRGSTFLAKIFSGSGKARGGGLLRAKIKSSKITILIFAKT